MKRTLKLLFSLGLASLLMASCNFDHSGSSNTEGNKLTYDSGDFVINTSGTSSDFAANMGMGWNLGNTLDATSNSGKTNVGLNTETYWGMPTTTQAMIKAVKAAGFKTIRIPVSWHNHITDSSYTIDSSWMARVKTIVDWAIDEGMCVIINIHHDNMSVSQLSSNYGFALSTDSSVQETSKAFLSAVWTQIATTFAEYDEALVFEVLNEPRDISGEVWGNEWWCNNSQAYDCIKDYEETCIAAIRAVAGNESRYLMVPGYAASASDTTELGCYTMPSDTITANGTKKLILSGHAYSPYTFAMSDSTDTTFDSEDASSLTSLFDYLNTNYISKGIGVVMGEASASDKNNTAERVKWAKDYYAKATAIKIPVVLWDNMVTVANGGNIDSGECHGYFNRNDLTWYFPSIIKAMGSEVYEDYAEKVTINNESDEDNDDDEDDENQLVILSESDTPQVLDNWEYNWEILSSYFNDATDEGYLTFTTSENSTSSEYSNLKLQAADWTDVFTAGTVTGATVGEGVLIPTSAAGTIVYKPTADEWSVIKEKGLIVYGYGLTINKLVLTY